MAVSGRLHYFLLCDAVVPCAGKKIFYGVFNQINAFDFPAVHAMCAIAVEISTTEGEHEMQFSLKDSSGADVMPPTPPLKAVAMPPLGLIDAVVNLQNMRFEKPGIYSFEVKLDGQVLGARDFIVNEMKRH